MNFTDFVTWQILGTYAGALAMVLILTQLTKGWALIAKLPTQLWSYLLALGVLYTAYYFLGQLDASNAVLILFNAALVSLGANGGFDVIKKVFAAATGKEE